MLLQPMATTTPMQTTRVTSKFKVLNISISKIHRAKVARRATASTHPFM